MGNLASKKKQDLNKVGSQESPWNQTRPQPLAFCSLAKRPLPLNRLSGQPNSNHLLSISLFWISFRRDSISCNETTPPLFGVQLSPTSLFWTRDPFSTPNICGRLKNFFFMVKIKKIQSGSLPHLFFFYKKQNGFERDVIRNNLSRF